MASLYVHNYDSDFSVDIWELSHEVPTFFLIQKTSAVFIAVAVCSFVNLFVTTPKQPKGIWQMKKSQPLS